MRCRRAAIRFRRWRAGILAFGDSGLRVSGLLIGPGILQRLRLSGCNRGLAIFWSRLIRRLVLPLCLRFGRLEKGHIGTLTSSNTAQPGQDYNQ